MNTFKIVDIDQGYCRVLYEVKNNNEQKVYYCIQQESGSACVFYRCTDSPWCEPSHPVKIKEGMTVELEAPTGDTELEQAVRHYIKWTHGMKELEYENK